MILVDVNVLVYACRRDSVDHTAYKSWLASALAGELPVGIAPESLAAVVRITTHPRLWGEPLTTNDALAFANAVRNAPAAVAVQPGPAHWDIFANLCQESKVRGNLVSDAWIAALAIEHGGTLCTTDTDFGRFRALRWHHPLRA